MAGLPPDDRRDDLTDSAERRHYGGRIKGQGGLPIYLIETT
jgi:hypothetical protein